jgi:hypothetical protein
MNVDVAWLSVSFHSKCKITDSGQVWEYSQESASQGQEISLLSRNAHWKNGI